MKIDFKNLPIGKKILYILVAVLIAYFILWILMFLACKFSLGKLGPFLFESCIGKLLPFPKCVCLY